MALKKTDGCNVKGSRISVRYQHSPVQSHSNVAVDNGDLRQFSTQETGDTPEAVSIVLFLASYDW